MQEKRNGSDFNELINALTLKCIHIKECVRRLNTPIDDRMGHLNDGLYMFDTRLITPGHLNAELYMRVGLQCGLYEK